ncbi:MAG: ribonuclease III [Candidatus Uhrbacteria bacterium]
MRNVECGIASAIHHSSFVPDLSVLEQSLGVTFTNKDLLLQSVTHRSYLNENATFHLGHNERLEFLGDAVIELSVTEYLYRNYENPEGELTNWRAALVNAKMLSEIARGLDVDPHLLLSRGEAKETGKARQYILANAFEAIVGAIYLDQGMPVCDDFLARVLLPRLPEILEQQLYIDAKSRFQEIAQERMGITPHYDVLEESGPDHARRFVVGIYLGRELAAKGVGTSKQEAQMDAAAEALKAKGWH